MLKPSDLEIENYNALALSSHGLCVGVHSYKEYKNGVAGEIAGYAYDLVLPARKFEHITMKVPGAALIAPDVFNSPNVTVKIENIQDFHARWYKIATMSDYSLSCKASGFSIAK